jgi:hypothetical protein
MAFRETFQELLKPGALFEGNTVISHAGRFFNLCDILNLNIHTNSSCGRRTPGGRVEQNEFNSTRKPLPDGRRLAEPQAAGVSDRIACTKSSQSMRQQVAVMHEDITGFFAKEK